MDATRGLVVLPFSGWDAASAAYNDGVQLIEFTPTSIATAGAAHTTGWVERGIFVKNRIVSLSDLALSVVDYSNPLVPSVTASLTLARSVITAQPGGSTIAEVSSDWWDNDVTHSDVRVLPLSDAEENADESKAVDTAVDGVDAHVFTNGNFDYIVTRVQAPVPCTKGSVGSPGPAPAVPAGGGLPTKPPLQCYGWQEQVQVVDLSGGGAKLRGKVGLPIDPGAGSDRVGLVRLLRVRLVQRGGRRPGRREHPGVPPMGPPLRRPPHQAGRRLERSLRGRPFEPRRPERRVDGHHRRPDRLVGQHAGRRNHALHVALRMGRFRKRGRQGHQARGWRRPRHAADGPLLPGPDRSPRPKSSPDRLQDQRARRTRRGVRIEPGRPLHDRLRVGRADDEGLSRRDPDLRGPRVPAEQDAARRGRRQRDRARARPRT